MTTTDIPLTATDLKTIPVDWTELGYIFATLDNTTQAEFLVAFWENVSDEQILLIADAPAFGPAGQSTRAEVAEVFHELARAIDEGGKK